MLSPMSGCHGPYTCAILSRNFTAKQSLICLLWFCVVVTDIFLTVPAQENDSSKIQAWSSPRETRIIWIVNSSILSIARRICGMIQIKCSMNVSTTVQGCLCSIICCITWRKKHFMSTTQFIVHWSQ